MAAPPPPPGYGPQPKPRSAKPVAGGILTLLGGLITVGVFGFSAALITSMLEGYGFGLDIANLGLGTCLLIPIIFGILAIVGGIVACMRKLWGLALIGSILGLFGPGFIFCLIGLILIAISRKEF